MTPAGYDRRHLCKWLAAGHAYIYGSNLFSGCQDMPQKSSKRVDDRKGRWPLWADEARMEAIAKAARIRELVLRAEEAIERGRLEEARRLMALIHDKANDIEDIMRKAHEGKFRD